MDTLPRVYHTHALRTRDLYPGMGQAVAERTILRRKTDGTFETWAEVAHRVALGNSLLTRSEKERAREYEVLHRHLRAATVLLSGRHLQHGDETQPERNKEVFTNCCTAPTSFLKFYMLMNGSGVGRCVDDDMMLVNFDHAPDLRVVLSQDHPDFDWSAHESARDALHKYGPDSKNVTWYKVPDSREGWAKALELWEVMAFEKIHRGEMLILDFSDVRPKGSPIKGMQNRPASGPVVLINAFTKAASLKGAGLAPWRQTMYVDHYFSECVLVAGARRAASMTTKTWRDKTVIDFIRIKRPIEFESRDNEEILEIRRERRLTGFLWSSNNSVTVDAEFWRLVDLKRNDREYNDPLAVHARKVFRQITSCSYYDGTGEPGFINVDRLVNNLEGMDKINGHSFVGGARYQPEDDSEVFLHKLAKVAKRKRFPFIVNPCGEIALFIMGGYCTVGSVVPYHAETIEEAEEAFRVTTRALMRVNQMDSVFNVETERTQRIGVSMTGVHEFAWKFFKCTFRDLIDPDFSPVMEPFPKSGRQKAAQFWRTISRFNAAVIDEATRYAKELGINVPHTALTVKPEGTVAKLFGLTEGWHLPANGFYLRWVQFRHDDPLVKIYESAGYPTRSLRTYEGTTIVGFPTAPVITTLGMPEVVTASQATPEEQYTWLKLGEKYWIVGETGRDLGNQISYTLKYDPATVDYKDFVEMVKRNQREIRCCTVMPVEDVSSYEYTPEEAVNKGQYEELLNAIRETTVSEDVDKVHVDCIGGACPVDFSKETVVECTTT